MPITRSSVGTTVEFTELASAAVGGLTDGSTTDVVGSASSPSASTGNKVADVNHVHKLLAGTITNADVSDTAGITYGKLNLLDGIVNADINSAAAIAESKLSFDSVAGHDHNGTNSKQVDYANIANKSVVNADVSATANIAYSKLDLTDSIVNADINSAAAIAESKISFDTGTGHDHDGTDSKKVLGTNIDSTGGAANEVLTADGAGGSSWAAVAAGLSTVGTLSNVGAASPNTTSTTYVTVYSGAAASSIYGTTAYLVTLLKIDNAAATAYVQLYDVTGSAAVSGSELSTTSTSYVVKKSSALTITSGDRHLDLQIKTSNGSYAARLLGGTVIWYE